ncbi:transglycosylase SLT domain-containing protein [Chitinivorax sp. PXF-14]|uniref:transglycosylase SLT domain-containing protein n=1 Tax=Chitinivorax sp. PXF-14 TaxID=3230488 RepID=UPI0034675FCA
MIRLIVLGVLLTGWVGTAWAGDGARIAVPAQALRYRAELIRNGRAVWGIDAPTATFAAQIHQESRWRSDAVSPVGAQGIAQFMPATASWLAGAYPQQLGERQPTNPSWAMRALVIYDKYLWDRLAARNGCERMAMALSAYNGGLGWVIRDKARARQAGADALSWFGAIERFNAGRARLTWNENRGYPRLILKRYEPAYQAVGFGQGACA